MKSVEMIVQEIQRMRNLDLLEEQDSETDWTLKRLKYLLQWIKKTEEG